MSCQCHKYGILIICSSDRNLLPKTPELLGTPPLDPRRERVAGPACKSGGDGFLCVSFDRNISPYTPEPTGAPPTEPHAN